MRLCCNSGALPGADRFQAVPAWDTRTYTALRASARSPFSTDRRLQVSAPGFASTDEQAMSEEALSRFVRDSRARSGTDASGRNASAFNSKRWRSLAELGVTALPFNDSDGGLGGSLAAVMMVTGHPGNGLVREPSLEGLLTSGPLLAEDGR